MKRKMLISMAVAVVLVMALAATAMAAVSISGPSSVNTGDTIQVTVSGTGDGVNGAVSTQGLEFVSVSNNMCAQGAFVLLPNYGTTSATYTYTVTAGAGETVSVTLSNCEEAQGDTAVSIPGDSWSATVPAGQTPSEPSDQPTNSSEPTSTATNGGSSNGGGSGSGSSGTGSGNTDKMPKTGDATMDLWTLCVIAAGATGIAVFAGRKAFQK